MSRLLRTIYYCCSWVISFTSRLPENSSQRVVIRGCLFTNSLLVVQRLSSERKAVYNTPILRNVHRIKLDNDDVEFLFLTQLSQEKHLFPMVASQHVRNYSNCLQFRWFDGIKLPRLHRIFVSDRTISKGA